MAGGKDPAVLWYFSDWHSGTATFSRHLKGCYMDLLHAQFNSGHLSLEEIKTVLGVDFSNWNTLQKKFKADGSGLFFNEKLDNELKKRRAYSESRRKNRSSTHEEHMSTHKEDVNEDVNEVSSRGESAERGGTPSAIAADERFIYGKQMKDFQNIWNKFAVKHKLAQVQLIPQYRFEMIVRCIKNTAFDLQKVLTGLEKQKWGLTDEWKATFDKVFGDETFWVKCMESNTLTTEEERMETENFYICEGCKRKVKRTQKESHKFNCSNPNYWGLKPSQSQSIKDLLP